MRQRSCLFWCLLLLLLTNCTSISLIIPGATIESPEVAGSGKKQLGPMLEPARGVEYTDSASARPPDLSQAEELGTTHSLLHQGRFGLGDKFELGLQLGMDWADDNIQQTYMIIAKYQLFGPTKDKAKAGDASAGIYGRVSYTDAEGSGDQSETFGPGGFPWSAKVNATTLLAGFSFGYRIRDNFLFYLGGSYQDVISKIKVDQTAADDNSDPGGSYSLDRNGRSLAYGLGLQLRLGRVFYLHGKVMQHEFYLSGIPDEKGIWGTGGFFFYF